jgi:hypothetical protein
METLFLKDTMMYLLVFKGINENTCFYRIQNQNHCQCPHIREALAKVLKQANLSFRVKREIFYNQWGIRFLTEFTLSRTARFLSSFGMTCEGFGMTIRDFCKSLKSLCINCDCTPSVTGV